ncbi:hypothetical protein [Cellulomonas sp. S1-8]|uniref:hypothetical protein n=1 Tax=Cellulomonas sp. S1-8 TaxID=2904790 RepID=UPI002244B7C4|nr:hypothetical protein [Cellulomonas sp. S1-8]UZN02145.1 hypothetical protein OKX07_13750 [Cellulomonas sp. S1-8]
MTARRSPRPLIAALLVVPTMVLGACSPGQDGSAVLDPQEAPADWTSHTMGPIALAAPQDWAPFETAAGESADEAYALRQDAEGPGTGVHVSVTRLRSRDAAAAVANLVSVGEATLGAQDPSEELLTWPGAEDAAFLSYTATLPTDDGDLDVRYEYLVLDLADEAQAVVAVIAPVETFDASGAHDVLASVTVS